MLVETQRFEAKSATGAVYTVIERQTIIRKKLVNGKHYEVRGIKILALSDGRDVNYIGGNTFKIVMTDEIIRKI